uniref:replication restart helicase PriA n=1 Tax=Succinivibrio sp. TaxID=2053619 RepID=UPI003FF074EE
KKGLVKLFNENIESNKFYENANEILKETPPKPNLEQQNAILTISNCHGFNTFLLNGITGSGKTEVYLRVIENVLKEGKAVLILVPEIALTPQTFDRFYRRFNVPVSSMHSALSDRERLDAYIDMATSKSGILIGTRTALFTPIPNLGLIVIDEEHDSSFKQNDSFRYHARNLAIMRAKLNNCPIVLGSATPSLETIYNVQKGVYQKIDLTIRAGGATVPNFELIDLRNEPLTDGLKTGICQTLEDEIGEETAKGNQVLLFLNRRGFAHHLVCHQCGHVFVCPNCDNLLTVHKKANRLQCHVCENFYEIPKTCYVCGNDELVEQGFGTEQVSEFLEHRYPDIGVERIDRDSVTTKKQLETKLNRIRQGTSKIMLGTQMLAKGHDFPDVTLVGILDVDSSLFSDDFRSLENTAQLLTQVSGRSGRGKKQGKVVIQTHHPDNLLINQLIDPNCNYMTIADDLLETRKSMMLPPFSSQAFILCNSQNRTKAFNFLSDVYRKLNNLKDDYPNLALTHVLSDKMEKVQNRYHF